MNYNNPFYYPLYNGRYPYFENYTPVDKPPTLYSVLNAYINHNSETYTKTGELAAACRGFVFDFSYTLSSGITKAEFEELFIDRFLERRIGFETFNSFKIHLRAKLREILPYYNKLLDSLADLSVIYDDEYTRTYTESSTSEGQETLDRDTTGRTVKDNDSTTSETTTGTSKTKFSDTPQNQLSNVEQNKYMTDYTDVATGGTSSGSGTIDETVNSTGTDDYTKDNTLETTKEISDVSTRPFANRMENYQKYLETKQSILTLLFNDLDELFFQIY